MRLNTLRYSRVTLVIVTSTIVFAAYRGWYSLCHWETSTDKILFSEAIDCPHCTENWAYLALLQSRLIELSHSQMLAEMELHTQVHCTWKLRFSDDRRCVDSACPNQLAPRLSKTNINSIRKPVIEFGGSISESVEHHFDLGLSRNQYVFLTAATSEYFNQSQAAIRSLHENVFPYISNYTFYYYDLGLTEDQRNLVHNSGAVLRKYPCENLPERLRYVTCMTWKPLIIQAHFNEGDYVVWFDSSVRFLKDISPLVSRVERTGIVIEGAETQFPQHVMMDMFSYFGDTPCQFAAHSEVKSRFMMFHNHLFTKHLIIEPWVACALDPDCMCTEDSRSMTFCDSGETHFGKCHRYDQSAIGYILIKLLRDFVPSVHLQLGAFHEIGRDGDDFLYLIGNTSVTIAPTTKEKPEEDIQFEDNEELEY